VGKVISELIADGAASTLDISSLHIERFGKGELLEEPLTAFKE
jgi:hypothetical protein